MFRLDRVVYPVVRGAATHVEKPKPLYVVIDDSDDDEETLAFKKRFLGPRDDVKVNISEFTFWVTEEDHRELLDFKYVVEFQGSDDIHIHRIQYSDFDNADCEVDDAGLARYDFADNDDGQGHLYLHNLEYPMDPDPLAKTVMVLDPKKPGLPRYQFPERFIMLDSLGHWTAEEWKSKLKPDVAYYLQREPELMKDIRHGAVGEWSLESIQAYVLKLREETNDSRYHCHDLEDAKKFWGRYFRLNHADFESTKIFIDNLFDEFYAKYPSLISQVKLCVDLHNAEGQEWINNNKRARVETFGRVSH